MSSGNEERTATLMIKQVMDLGFKHSKKPFERIHKNLSERDLPGDRSCKHPQLRT